MTPNRGSCQSIEHAALLANLAETSSTVRLVAVNNISSLTQALKDRLAELLLFGSDHQVVFDPAKLWVTA